MSPSTYQQAGINDRKGAGWRMVLKDLMSIVHCEHGKRVTKCNQCRWR